MHMNLKINKTDEKKKLQSTIPVGNSHQWQQLVMLLIALHLANYKVLVVFPDMDQKNESRNVIIKKFK